MHQFLSKYGFLKSDKWDEQNLPEEAEFLSDESPDVKDTVPLIHEGTSSSRRGSESDNPTESSNFISALKEFQMMSGLPVTGVFDDATKAAMNKPRCGVSDRGSPTGPTSTQNPTLWAPSPITARTSTESTADSAARDTANDTASRIHDQESPNANRSRKKRHLAMLLSKSRPRRSTGDELGLMAFSKKVLTWRLIGEGYSSQLSIDDQKYIFKLAFRMWSEVSPLEFAEDTHSPLEEIDIKLGFGTGRHLGCAQTFDGAGQEFAHAWFLGDIHFDDDEHFTGLNAGTGISLLKVAVHEIGHVLGLPHIYRPGSIMQPSYLPQDSSFELDWLDRKAIQQLYGGCKGRFSTVFDWIRRERTAYGEVVIRFNTYFMRDGWYWLYENRSNRTRYGDPVAVRVGWHGIPASGVDAYVHVWTWTLDAVYFFKGTRYWRYDSENDQAYAEDSEGRKYPRLISEGFPGVPRPIDTAFFDRRNSHIYFFKGMDVYSFDVVTNAVASGFPQRISEVFPAVKRVRFWRLVSSRDRWLHPSLPRNGVLPGQQVDQQWFDICNVHDSALKMSA
ncbi:matrix metalloproteinase-21-like [Scleropages formosus]|uniref:Matrix metalloproteinase-21-like n=1 Tax=Scleropages formosus TaxID=113540 RepID=A0A0N8JXD3_SCLFO|nr:matrix metalloproteinase-21-like [Scleropages formosus]